MSENNLEALLQRGKLELENEQYETALATFQQADSLFPDNAEVKLYLGYAFCGLEQYKTALECLDLALKIAPDNRSAAEAKKELLARWRNRSYLQLIEALLQCAEGEEGEILSLNEHLVDTGLIATIETTAAEYERAGNNNLSRSKWLQNLVQYTTRYIEETQPTQAHYNFLLEILRTIDNDGEREQVYSLLRKNLDKLDLKLAKALQNWANNALSPTEKLETKKSLGYLIFDFCVFIEDFPLGNRAVNLEIAITGYDISLTIFTKADFSLEWATIQYNLGTSYLKRIKGDKAENIESAIAAYEQALTVYTASEFLDWADTQYNLGIAYRDRIRGDKAENIERAISFFENALTIRTASEFPVNWAKIQYSLGVAYSDRIRGHKAENIERVIESYQKALTIRTASEFPVDWANTQYNLGIAYRDRIRGDKAENIEQAIQSYENALTIHTATDYPDEWARIQLNLGITYTDRIRGERAENIKRAIESCQNALTIHTATDYPDEWARIQLNLGNIYNDRIRGERAENIERAIASCQNALTIHTATDYPDEWVRIQNSLGIAYSNRTRGNKGDNLEQAIESFQNALTIHTATDYPDEWARIQLNLGNVYRDRIRGDRVENIERAIEFCQNGLTIVAIATDFPRTWANIQSSLGNAYVYRIRGDKAENIERAIKSYENALTVYTATDFLYEWANIQNCLSIAYGDRITGNKAENLERAIEFCQNALTIHTATDYPDEWAMIQFNLGIAYGDRITGNKAENLERAIEFCQNALTIHTATNFPHEWARIQNGLGVTYSDRIRGERAENLERAIESYQNALTIHTVMDFPVECLQTARNLGDLAFSQGNWQLAIEAYTLAVEAVEQSRSWAKSDTSKQEILSSAIDVYQNIVQACINLGQIDKAIEYAERSKSRNLVELLATRDLYPKGNIPQQVIDNLNRLRQEIIVEERRLGQQSQERNNLKSSSEDNSSRNPQTISSSSSQAIEPSRLSQLKQELNNLLQKEINDIDPDFQLTQRVEPISFNEIQASLPTPQTVLVEWYLGNDTLTAFIVTCQQQTPIHITYTAEKLEALIDKAGEYLDIYLQRDSQWQNRLPDLLTQLAEHLQLATIIERIKQIVPDVNRLILVPHRWLHLLPLHALTIGNGQCLLDIFSSGVSYAPSVQLLKLTQKQQQPPRQNFFAVQNPTDDLAFTDFEVLTIEPLFDPHNDILKRAKANKTALTSERLSKANCVHFSCHGYFNFEKPELSALLLADSKTDAPVEQSAEQETTKTRFLPSRDGGSIDIDKCLTLGEIFGLDLRQTRLVVLSACETGLTDFRSLSDEYIGLPSGFLYAGSPNVVSSLWAVNDLATAFLMIKLYQNLEETESVPIALNQAQMWLKNVTKEELERWGASLNLRDANQARFETAMAQYEANSRPFASPYYWAAFCAVGY